MCVAVPGRVMAIYGGDEGLRMGKIDLQGSCLEASLLLTPEAGVGDWVLVHAGFAIRRLDECEALETWGYLRDCDTFGLDGAACGRRILWSALS